MVHHHDSSADHKSRFVAVKTHELSFELHHIRQVELRKIMFWSECKEMTCWTKIYIESRSRICDKSIFYFEKSFSSEDIKKPEKWWSECIC